MQLIASTRVLVAARQSSASSTARSAPAAAMSLSQLSRRCRSVHACLLTTHAVWLVRNSAGVFGDGLPVKLGVLRSLAAEVCVCPQASRLRMTVQPIPLLRGCAPNSFRVVNYRLRESRQLCRVLTSHLCAGRVLQVVSLAVMSVAPLLCCRAVLRECTSRICPLDSPW